MKMTMKQTVDSKIVARLLRSEEILGSYIASLKAIVPDPSISHVVDSIHSVIDRGGKVITTGMGKAGIAMRKFSSTLCSLGIPSCYLHPGEASHGDAGIMTWGHDMLFVASTSGKTREVIETVDMAINLGISPIVGITSHTDSVIRQKANIVIDMGRIEEACSLGLAPTTSIVVMMVVTDAIALIVSEERGFSREDYGTFHHSGYLGSKARGETKE